MCVNSTAGSVLSEQFRFHSFWYFLLFKSACEWQPSTAVDPSSYKGFSCWQGFDSYSGFGKQKLVVKEHQSPHSEMLSAAVYSWLTSSVPAYPWSQITIAESLCSIGLITRKSLLIKWVLRFYTSSTLLHWSVTQLQLMCCLSFMASLTFSICPYRIY